MRKSIWAKLTKAELIHVIEECLVNDALHEFKKTRKAQKEFQKLSVTKRETCFECRTIAIKLGIEE